MSKYIKISPELVLRAYELGLFPMAKQHDSDEIMWVEPKLRGLIPLDERFHISRSLKKTIRKGGYEVTFDQHFTKVIDYCAELSDERDETWINDEIKAIFTLLYHQGHAHSLEVSLNGRLVGGLYGVAMGGVFFGESMFSKMRDMSKIALVHLVTRLKAANYQLLDAQFQSPHLMQFGCYEMPQEQFRVELTKAFDRECYFLTQYKSDEVFQLLNNTQPKIQS